MPSETPNYTKLSLQVWKANYILFLEFLGHYHLYMSSSLNIHIKSSQMRSYKQTKAHHTYSLLAPLNCPVILRFSTDTLYNSVKIPKFVLWLSWVFKCLILSRFTLGESITRLLSTWPRLTLTTSHWVCKGLVEQLLTPSLKLSFSILYFKVVHHCPVL